MSTKIQDLPDERELIDIESLDRQVLEEHSNVKIPKSIIKQSLENSGIFCKDGILKKLYNYIGLLLILIIFSSPYIKPILETFVNAGEYQYVAYSLIITIIYYIYDTYGLDIISI